MKLFDFKTNDDINSKPKFIFQLWCIHHQLCGGYMKCNNAFQIWKFMMTHDIERLYERCHGLNTFDEFYACLGGDRGVSGENF